MVANPAEFEDSIRCICRQRSNEVPTFGLIGQIIGRKGHHVVIEAMARIRERFPDLQFRLRVFGSGPDDYVNRVKSLAATRGVEHLVEWCGYQSSRDDIYPEIDFGVVPTTDPEPFGLVAIEPAVYGKPVIASATGGLPEIIRDGVTGFLVPPSDVDFLADRIAKLIADPALVRSLGERAYTDYKDRFSVTQFVDAYSRIIDSLMENQN